MVRCLRYANHYPSSVGLPTSAWSVERTESDGRGTTMRPPPTYRQRGPGRRAGKARTQPGNTQQWAPIQSRGFPLGVRSAQRTALLPQSARKTKKDVAHQATKDREEHPPVTHSAGLFRQPADGGPMQPRAADALAQSVSDITAGWAAAQGVDPSTLAAASLVLARSSIAAGPEVLRCLVRTTTGTVVPTPTLTDRAPPAHRAARRAAGASTTLAVIRRPALANRANPTGVPTLAVDQHEVEMPCTASRSDCAITQVLSQAFTPGGFGTYHTRGLESAVGHHRDHGPARGRRARRRPAGSRHGPEHSRAICSRPRSRRRRCCERVENDSGRPKRGSAASAGSSRRNGTSGVRGRAAAAPRIAQRSARGVGGMCWML